VDIDSSVCVFKKPSRANRIGFALYIHLYTHWAGIPPFPSIQAEHCTANPIETIFKRIEKVCVVVVCAKNLVRYCLCIEFVYCKKWKLLRWSFSAIGRKQRAKVLSWKPNELRKCDWLVFYKPPKLALMVCKCCAACSRLVDE
jgi:hypothetical protein